MTILLIAGYFFVLYEFVLESHRSTCAKSDARIEEEMTNRVLDSIVTTNGDWEEAFNARDFYWFRHIQGSLA